MRDRGGRRHTTAMKTQSTTGLVQRRILVLAFVIAATLSAALPVSLFGADASPSPEVSVSPDVAACESAADLQLIVGFLGGLDASEDGWLPVIVGVIGGLSEARTLAGLVGEIYGPLVDDVVGSLEGLRVTAEALADEETAGAKLAAVGESVTEVGNAMDALAVQLRTRCSDIE
jgi:hypothetical protein